MQLTKIKSEMKPTSKTPYEIRLELLQLAQSILNTQRQGLTDSLSPTTEEIVAEAEKMNAFVSKANLNH